MLLAGGKCRFPFAAMFFGIPGKVRHAAQEQDRREGGALLLRRRRAAVDRLYGDTIGLPDFEIVLGRIIVRAN